MTKTPPTEDEVLAWYLFRYMDEEPPDELEPARILRLIREYKQMGLLVADRMLYNEFENYREAFPVRPARS